MKLTAEQVNHLIEVVNHIREFERADYMDWNRDTDGDMADKHVYFHASKLAGLITNWKNEESLDVKDIERHRGLEIGEDGTVKGIFDLSN